MRLAAAGVGAVEKFGLDICADESRFYPHRSATHRGDPGVGREIALIRLSIFVRKKW